MQPVTRKPAARIGTMCIAATLFVGCAPAKAPQPTPGTTSAAPTSSAAGDASTAHVRPDVPQDARPTAAAPGTGVLDNIPHVPRRISRGDYRRAAFGDNWTDDNDAPGGHNGCDTRNDILDRDLVEKTYKSISSCPIAVATGILHDPYTETVIAFTRGAKTGAAVQIDHIVPLAYAWDMGASTWTEDMRVRFANDPANLIAVQGDSNQSKGDKEPAKWMPPNTAFECQYVERFTDVLRAYGLPIDVPSAAVVVRTAQTCPAA